MRVAFVIAVALCVACSSQKVAREIITGGCGENANYTLNIETGLMLISGTGEMTDFKSSEDVPWKKNRYNITTLVIDDGITVVSRNSFYGCTHLTSVSLPSSVVTIQPWAFQSCNNLTSVSIPANVSMVCPGAFAHCSGLVSIDVDKDNTKYRTIDGILFDKKGTQIVEYPCGKSDTSYIIPSNVTFISNYAFMGCRNLTSMTIPPSVTTMGGWCFSDTYITSLEIPPNVTSFLTGLCSSCTYLKTAVIGSGIKKIPDKTFEGCSSLTSVTLPPTITSIGANAFDKCKSLESLTIPAAVDSIADSAFKECFNLTSVTFLGSTAPECKKTSFDKCENLTRVCVPSNYKSKLFCSKAAKDCNSTSGASRISNSLFFIAIVILISIMLA